MINGSSRLQRCQVNITRTAAAAVRWIIEPSPKVEPKQRRRVRMLSVFLLIMSINAMTGMLILNKIGGDAWLVLEAARATLFVGYLVSRTRYYRAALAVAIAVPALPPLAIALFKPPEVSLTAELMWLALPLIVATLMLSLRPIIIIVAFYIAFIITLRAFDLMEYSVMAPALGFISIFTFFILAISVIRRKDQTEIENKLIEHQKMQETLEIEAMRRRILIEHSRDGIVILDQNGAVYETNRRFAEMLGYSPEEVLKLNVWDWEFLYPPEQVREMINTVGEAGDHFQTRHRRKDGTVYDVEISTNGAMFGGQKLIFCVCRDITERKKTEGQLKEAMANLEQSSSRLAATNKELEAFSYSVSHDLRAPLRSIDGFSQALLEDYQEKLDETGQDYLRRLRGASQKMGELIDGILKLSRLTRSEMHHEPINLSALAREIADRLKETQPKRKVKFLIDKELTADGDPQLLRVLLENLLSNAWKFTSREPQARIEFSMERNNGKKAYFIRDNGAGFDMTYADKLFGAFQRLHDVSEFPGTGIGLATVQRIINRHGGTIWAEGAVGKGATFHFTLD